MIFGPKRGEQSHRTAIIRDIVEVIAIVGAGVWAIYTFLYLEQLKPAAEPPELTISGNLHKLEVRNGLVEFGYDGVIRNIGHTSAYLIAEGFTITGVRVDPLSSPTVISPYKGAMVYQRDARIETPRVVYKFYKLTRYAHADFGDGYKIDPGQEIPFSGVFAVRDGEFDSIALDGSLAYAKNVGTYPTKIGHTPSGVVLFDPVKANDPNYYPLQVTLDRASLR